MNSKDSVFLKEIANDFCESVKNGPVLIDPIESIMTGTIKFQEK